VRRLAAAAVCALLSCGPLAAGAQTPPPRGAEAAQPAPIPFRKDDDAGALALNVIVGLGASLAIGIGVLVVLRRYLTRIQQGPGRRLRVIETLRLTPKSALFLVECDGETLLIGQQGETLCALPLSPAPRYGADVAARRDAAVAAARDAAVAAADTATPNPNGAPRA
jgi:flagellar biogenesis protein FliO